MKYEKLVSLSDEGLVHKELQLERELIAATFRLRTGQLDDSSQVGKLRRDLARTRTAQRAREIAQKLRPNALRDLHRSTFSAQQAVSVATGAKGGGFLKGLATKLGIGKSDSAGETAEQAAE